MLKTLMALLALMTLPDTVGKNDTYPEGDETNPRDRHLEAGKKAAATFGAGLPQEYREDWKAITKALGAAQVAATTAVEKAAELNDPTRPQPIDPHRAMEELLEAKDSDARVALGDADERLTALEARLRRDALAPAPGGQKEALARDQILLSVGDLTDARALHTLEALTASSNPEVVATLVGEWGRALARSRGIDDADFERVVDLVVGAAADGRLGAKYKAVGRSARGFTTAKEAYTNYSAGATGHIKALRARA